MNTLKKASIGIVSSVLLGAIIMYIVIFVNDRTYGVKQLRYSSVSITGFRYSEFPMDSESFTGWKELYQCKITPKNEFSFVTSVSSKRSIFHETDTTQYFYVKYGGEATNKGGYSDCPKGDFYLKVNKKSFDTLLQRAKDKDAVLENLTRHSEKLLES